nr:hypothetical protein [Tanacetum cinerariifolium]
MVMLEIQYIWWCFEGGAAQGYACARKLRFESSSNNQGDASFSTSWLRYFITREGSNTKYASLLSTGQHEGVLNKKEQFSKFRQERVKRRPHSLRLLSICNCAPRIIPEMSIEPSCAPIEGLCETSTGPMVVIDNVPVEKASISRVKPKAGRVSYFPH